MNANKRDRERRPTFHLAHQKYLLLSSECVYSRVEVAVEVSIHIEACILNRAFIFGWRIAAYVCAIRFPSQLRKCTWNLSQNIEIPLLQTRKILRLFSHSLCKYSTVQTSIHLRRQIEIPDNNIISIECKCSERIRDKLSPKPKYWYCFVQIISSQFRKTRQKKEMTTINLFETCVGAIE